MATVKLEPSMQLKSQVADTLSNTDILKLVSTTNYTSILNID